MANAESTLILRIVGGLEGAFAAGSGFLLLEGGRPSLAGSGAGVSPSTAGFITATERGCPCGTPGSTGC